MEKKTVTFKRTQLYEEIWEKSLSKVAKLYEVPYSKLKDACQNANIPLPPPSYWGDLYCGKKVENIPLPDFTQDTVTVSFHVRQKAPEESESIPQKDIGAIVSSVSEPAVPTKAASDGRDLYRREILYQEVWNTPIPKVAEKYGVPDALIQKACMALNVPLPSNGYWAKKQAGEDVPPSPLPDLHGSTGSAENKPDQDPAENEAKQADDSLSFLPDDELIRVLKQCLEIKVDMDKKKLHKVLTRHKASYQAYIKKHPRDPLQSWSKDTYRNIPPDEPPLYNSVTADTIPRVYRILDSLYTAIEALGGTVNQDMSVQIRGEHVAFSVTEGQQQVPHVLTKEEQKQFDQYEFARKHHQYAYKPNTRKYDYIANGRLTIGINKRRAFRDTKENILETRVGEILYALYRESEAVRIDREAKEAAKRKAEEEERQRQIRIQLYNTEVEKLDRLKNEAADYEMACRIRAYAAALEQLPELSPSQIKHINWMREKADWYDPTVSADDPLFGQRYHASPREPEKKYRW